MAVIPSGSKTDPFQLAVEFLRSQRTAANADRRTGDMVHLQMLKDQGVEENTYRRYRGYGRAKIKNAEDAIAAGLDPSLAGSGRSRATPTGTKAAKELERGLRDGGVNNPVALAAALGHAQIESGFNPTIVGDDGHAFGSFQHNDRQPRLREWVAKNGGNANDPYWQGRFAAWEMQNTEKPAGDRILNAKNMDEANEGMVSFLRPKGAEGGMRTVIHGNERRNASEAWYKKLTSTSQAQFNEQSAPTMGDADGWEIDENGRKYKTQYATASQINTLFANDLAMKKRMMPDLGKPTKKGQIAWRYYPEEVQQQETPKLDLNVEDDFDPTTGE